MTSYINTQILESLEHGVRTVPDLIDDIFPDLESWKRASRRSQIYHRMVFFEKHGIVRKVGITRDLNGIPVAEWVLV